MPTWKFSCLNSMCSCDGVEGWLCVGGVAGVDRAPPGAPDLLRRTPSSPQPWSHSPTTPPSAPSHPPLPSLFSPLGGPYWKVTIMIIQNYSKTYSLSANSFHYWYTIYCDHNEVHSSKVNPLTTKVICAEQFWLWCFLNEKIIPIKITHVWPLFTK